GDCVENEWHNAENGDGLQRTTHGLLVWRAADNWTAFTDGYTTWINGPNGIESRLNTGPLLSWEKPSPPAAIAGEPDTRFLPPPPRPGAALPPPRPVAPHIDRVG